SSAPRALRTASICFCTWRERSAMRSSVISSSLKITSSRIVRSPAWSWSPSSMTFFATSGVREIDLMTASLPRSIRRAISTSPSRVSSGTVPISRRYIRTGSFVLSSAPGVRSSSSSSAPSAVRSRTFSSRMYFWSESMTSMPALPKVLKRSSSSSEEVISEGSSSLTSSYSRYPFSLPILISCRTSSYFSSIDIYVFPQVLSNLLNLVQEIYLLPPQRVNFVSMLARPYRLEPVNLALNGRPFTLPAQPFQGPSALERWRRRGRGGGDTGHELQTYCT